MKEEEEEEEEEDSMQLESRFGVRLVNRRTSV